MPPEPQLEVLGNAAGVPADPGLMRVKDDPDLTGTRACLIGSCLILIKFSPMACDERTVDNPAAHRLKMARPSSPSGRSRDRGSISMGRGG
jgi:hypothetical protein